MLYPFIILSEVTFILYNSGLIIFYISREMHEMKNSGLPVYQS